MGTWEHGNMGTWEPEINLANAPALLTAYWEAMGEVTNYKPAKD
jgi:hypothetical protein